MIDKNYTKITYESCPIGKERIVLYLTTLDLEAFDKNKDLHKIPEKRIAIEYEFDRFEYLDNKNLLNNMQKEYEMFIRNTYDSQLKEMQRYIEYLRCQELDYFPKAKWYELKENNKL